MGEAGEERGARLFRSIGAFSATALGRVLTALLYAACGACIVTVAAFVAYLESRPDLEVWHRAHLDAEFTEDSDVETLDAYRALEDRLFEELEAEVFGRIDEADRTNINRFHRGSLADPARWPTDWNRTFEMPSGSARVGVLLLHGMSDSPYSLRALAERLNEREAWVVGLRLPGHGTAPSGLTDVRWEDMEKAVRIAVRHLRGRVDGPVYIVGYSTGGALGVHYAVRALRDDALPQVGGIVAISPAIGVSRAAAFAVWQGRMGRWLGLDKLAWNEIYPEYDPFKYGSFAVNAGDVVYRLSIALQDEIARSSDEDLKRLPPILAFQSAVDATVISGAVVDGLFERLPDNGNALVLFDINRFANVGTVLASDPSSLIDPLLTGDPRTFDVAVLTNEHVGSAEVVIRERKAGTTTVNVMETEMTWPPDVYSVSHVALPTPFDDPLYGGDPNAKSPGIQLGRLAYRGERGVLRVSPAAMLRLQWNPFYPWMEKKIVGFMGLGAKDGDPMTEDGGQ
jgi:alpha-beta hydrolase superfamily lysophospholipase